MNIVFICKSITGGGAERFSVNMVNYLSASEESNVYIVTEKIKENEYFLDNRVKRFDFLKSKAYFFNILKIIHFAIDKKIDVIVGIDIEPNLLVCMTNLFIKSKCIISERNAPKQVNISRISRILRFIFYRFADGFIFQTEGAKSFYSKKIQKRSVVIHNPVKKDLIYKSNIDKNEIVAIGRLNIQKNYPMLIKAFSKVHLKHNDYTLRIFGEGNEKEKLQNLCKDLGVEKYVSFEGFTLNVHEAIKDSQIFVMTSDFEGMPNALLEAMAMGFPVISTDCPAGGPFELINNGDNGILVPIKDDNILAEKLCLLIENLDFRHFISKNAVRIRDTHDISFIMKKWNDFLEFNSK